MRLISRLVPAAVFSAIMASHAVAQDRINPMLDLLDEGKPLFGAWVNYIGGGSDSHSAVAMSQSGFDFVIYEMEHSGFDVTKLQNYLQWLLDRRAIAESGSNVAQMPVIVRVPANGREGNQWIAKGVLDSGAHGLLFPFTETVEQVEQLIGSMRYPQPDGSPDMEPTGYRGWSPSMAARYWGMSTDEYTQRADIWRRDPQGSLIPFFLIESETGLNNVRDIAQYLSDNQVGAVLYAGSADLGMSLGGDPARLAEALDTILAVGKEFNIPVAVNWPADEGGFVEEFEKGGNIFVGVSRVTLPGAETMRALGRD